MVADNSYSSSKGRVYIIFGQGGVGDKTCPNTGPFPLNTPGVHSLTHLTNPKGGHILGVTSGDGSFGASLAVGNVNDSLNSGKPVNSIVINDWYGGTNGRTYVLFGQTAWPDADSDAITASVLKTNAACTGPRPVASISTTRIAVRKVWGLLLRPAT